jgi:hypothetical protein
MKLKGLFAGISLLILSYGSATYGQSADKSPLKYNGGIVLGYNRGLGVQTNLTASNFGSTFPAKLRLGLGLTFLNPGNAADARRIFINNATNGVPDDTSYSPDNDNVNPENDNQHDDAEFKYKDANKAIKQPEFMPRFMLGLNFNL